MYAQPHKVYGGKVDSYTFSFSYLSLKATCSVRALWTELHFTCSTEHLSHRSV